MSYIIERNLSFSKGQQQINMSLLNAPVGTYTLEVYVKAVVQLQTYPDGTVINANVRQDATPDLVNEVALTFEKQGAQVYYLNHGTETDGAAELDYMFSVASVADSDIFFLNLALPTATNKFWEPRNSSTEAWLNTRPIGLLESPQFGIVRLKLTPVATFHEIRRFRFSGFVDNIRLGGQR